MIILFICVCVICVILMCLFWRLSSFLLYFGIFKLLCVNLYIDGEECTGEDSDSDVLENYCGINDRLALFINGTSMLKHGISIN